MKRQAAIGFILAGLIAATAFVLFRSKKVAQAKTRIGSLLILSGKYAPYGRYIEQGQKLAQDYLKTKGVEVKRLQPLDFKASKKKLEELLRRSIRRDGITFFAGLMGTGFVAHCAKIITEKKILVVDGTATGDSLSGISPGFFRTIPADGKASMESLRWIKEEKHDKSIFLVYSDTKWGVGLKTSYLYAAKSLGLKIANLEKIPQDATIEQIAGAAKQIHRAKPSAIVLAVYGVEAAALMRKLKEDHETIPYMYGTDNLVGEFASKGGVFVKGARFVVAGGGEIKPMIRQMYIKAYGEPKGGNIPSYVISGFNAFIAVAKAYQASKGDAMKAREWLKTAKIDGAEGIFQFTKKGNFSGKGYVRKHFVIKKGKPISVVIK